MKRFSILPLVLLTAFAFAACDSTSEESEVGSYSAVEFTVENVDVLAAGGSLSLTLQEGGAVSGQLSIPELLAEGEETSFPMTGTYMRSGNTISFTQAADSFVRDASWVYDDGSIRGSFQSIQVVLEKN